METAVATLPNRSVEIRSHKGNWLGTRHFVGSQSASDIRAVGKSLGLKGVALTRYVNKALTDESASRAVATAAGVAALQAQGYSGDYFDVKGKTAVLKFVKPGATESKKGKIASLQAEIEKLKAELLAAKA
jgi:hypothetical protein